MTPRRDCPPRSGTQGGPAGWRGSGDEVAAEAERAFRRTTRPHRPQIDADGGKNGDMKNGEDVLRQIFGLLKFEGDSAEAEVQHTSAAGALFTDDGVGIRANHGNALSFSLNRV